MTSDSSGNNLILRERYLEYSGVQLSEDSEVDEIDLDVDIDTEDFDTTTTTICNHCNTVNFVTGKILNFEDHCLNCGYPL